MKYIALRQNVEIINRETPENISIKLIANWPTKYRETSREALDEIPRKLNVCQRTKFEKIRREMSDKLSRQFSMRRPKKKYREISP